MKLIPLSKTGKYKGKYFAMVDDEDFDKLNQHNWICYIMPKTVYARRKEGNKFIKMHNAIIETKEGLFVDHINHNGLDNQKVNLRLCNRTQNNANRTAYGTSKYLGVFKSRSGNWVAGIKVNKKRVYLGTYKEEKEAAMVYDKAAIIHHKEFANLNFKVTNGNNPD